MTPSLLALTGNHHDRALLSQTGPVTPRGAAARGAALVGTCPPAPRVQRVSGPTGPSSAHAEALAVRLSGRVVPGGRPPRRAEGHDLHPGEHDLLSGGGGPGEHQLPVLNGH